MGDTDPLNKTKVLSKAVEKLPYRESFHKRFFAAVFFTMFVESARLIGRIIIANETQNLLKRKRLRRSRRGTFRFASLLDYARRTDCAEPGSIVESGKLDSRRLRPFGFL
jgi:hypothetical protein